MKILIERQNDLEISPANSIKNDYRAKKFYCFTPYVKLIST
jgi:hypothetical protein